MQDYSSSNFPYVLPNENAQTVTNSTTETEIGKWTIPANLIQRPCFLDLDILRYTGNSSGSTNTITLRLKLAGSTIISTSLGVTAGSIIRSRHLHKIHYYSSNLYSNGTLFNTVANQITAFTNNATLGALTAFTPTSSNILTLTIQHSISTATTTTRLETANLMIYNIH